jgi:hypothetical protein
VAFLYYYLEIPGYRHMCAEVNMRSRA